MTPDQLTGALYRLVARLEDDHFLDYRTRQHAHQLREEIKAIHPNADEDYLPKDKP